MKPRLEFQLRTVAQLAIGRFALAHPQRGMPIVRPAGGASGDGQAQGDPRRALAAQQDEVGYEEESIDNRQRRGGFGRFITSVHDDWFPPTCSQRVGRPYVQKNVFSNVTNCRMPVYHL